MHKLILTGEPPRLAAGAYKITKIDEADAHVRIRSAHGRGALETRIRMHFQAIAFTGLAGFRIKSTPLKHVDWPIDDNDELIEARLIEIEETEVEDAVEKTHVFDLYHYERFDA
jgi:hypothetical protein